MCHVLACRHHLLSTTQEMFTFRHPNNDKPIDNNRYKRVLFERHPHDGSAILHGLAGWVCMSDAVPAGVLGLLLVVARKGSPV
jgi:hypothetical protein